MRFFFILILFFCFSSFSQEPDTLPLEDPPWGPRDNEPLFLKFFIRDAKAFDPCEFKATVTPEHQTERVKEIYEDMCTWFSKTFRVIPEPNIPLQSVKFVDSWKEVEWITQEPFGNLYAAFYSIKKKDISEIVIIDESTPKEYWFDNPLHKDSVIAHEIVHYLVKASVFESISKIDNINRAIGESHAYWCQDKYIKRHSFGEKGLLDFVINRDDKDLVIDFVFLSYNLYDMAPEKYLYNAIKWFGLSPLKNFEDIIRGKYVYQGSLY